MIMSNYNFTLTRIAEIPIVGTMRWKACMILLAIGLSMIVPPSLPWLANSGQESAIGVLDVCHSATPSLSINGDMSCISECPCNPLPLAVVSVYSIPRLSFKPLLIALQDERPPRA